MRRVVLHVGCFMWVVMVLVDVCRDGMMACVVMRCLCLLLDTAATTLTLPPTLTLRSTLTLPPTLTLSGSGWCLMVRLRLHQDGAAHGAPPPPPRSSHPLPLPPPSLAS